MGIHKDKSSREPVPDNCTRKSPADGDNGVKATDETTLERDQKPTRTSVSERTFLRRKVKRSPKGGIQKGGYSSSELSV